MSRRRGQDRALLIAIFAGVVAVRLLYLALTRITYEDSLISLRYAQNLAQGLGLVYNPGERVFGASTPLYVLLLSLLSALRLPAPLLAARLLSAAADGFTAVLWFRLLGKETGSRLAGSLFALVFGLSAFLAPNSVSGMETSFALLCLTLAFRADRDDRPWALGAWLGLLMLVRPDGALAAAVILAVRAARDRRLPWQPALLAALVVLPWVAFAWSYYGTPVPNSVLAKSAAYNRHLPGIRRNLLYTLNQFAPVSASWPERLFNAAILALLAAGLLDVATRRRRLLAVPLFWLAWWAYLVLPRTLLFLWYYPPMTMCAYVLAGLGFARLNGEVERRMPRAGPFFRWGVPAYLVCCAVPWLFQVGERAAQVQLAEENGRKPIGHWLARHTPPQARVAVEPIGYIGYYSRRRILDEVGLVSPEMIRFTRAGGGWFGRAMRHFRPDYVVERPYYLEKNLTINTRVPMFSSEEDRRWFEQAYEPVAAFPEGGRPLALPGKLERDYRFVIFRRRADG